MRLITCTLLCLTASSTLHSMESSINHQEVTRVSSSYSGVASPVAEHVMTMAPAGADYVLRAASLRLLNVPSARSLSQSPLPQRRGIASMDDNNGNDGSDDGQDNQLSLTTPSYFPPQEEEPQLYDYEPMRFQDMPLIANRAGDPQCMRFSVPASTARFRENFCQRLWGYLNQLDDESSDSEDEEEVGRGESPSWLGWETDEE